jgi:hypothetical protein
MQRGSLFSCGTLLRLAAGTILWNAPDLDLFTDAGHAGGFTHLVGLGVLAEGRSPWTAAPKQGGTAAPGRAPETAGGEPVARLREHGTSSWGR